MHSFGAEKNFLNSGYDGVVGVDEAGRGPLAGPVVAASFLFNKPLKIYSILSEVNDSKKLSMKKRTYIYDTLTSEFGDSISWVAIDHSEIDKINILKATLSAMRKSIELLKVPQNTIILIDGKQIIPNYKLAQKAVIGGDSKIFAIAAASIIAKVARDKIMSDLDGKYPQYGFAKNKGYGTKEHLRALEKHGPCPIHRRSYAPVKNFI